MINMIMKFVLSAVMVLSSNAWAPVGVSRFPGSRNSNTRLYEKGSLHGEDSCFLPLLQCDQDYYAPRIIQIAGAYPGLKKEEFLAVSSEPPAEPGQWAYDFSDPEGPQLGTVAVEGSVSIFESEDPVAIIAEHKSLGVTLSPKITGDVDLLVVVDRALGFGERKFLVVEDPAREDLVIAAYPAKAAMPPGAKVLGRLVLVQIPWLEGMKETKTGFLEADEYF